MNNLKNQLKCVYDALPFKKQFFDVLKLIWTPSENIYKHLHFQGIIDIEVEKKNCFKMMHRGFQIENELYWEGINGGIEKKSLEIWIQLSRMSNVIFDIGANTGVYALVSKSINTKAKVHAFEPIPYVFNILENNNRLNHYDINLNNFALSNYKGTASIYIEADKDFSYSVTVNKNLNNLTTNVKTLKIETNTISNYVNMNKIEKIDLLKIDVETHEVEVLEGFLEHIGKFRPTMLIEILNEEVAKGVYEIIKDLDYLFFNINDKDNSIRQTGVLEKSDFFNYLICSEEIAKKLEII
jgi:FkbM family methyltransferase